MPTFSQVIELFSVARRAQRFSPHTLADYGVTFRKFIAFHGDLEFVAIHIEHIEQFLADMPGAAKTVLNAHAALSSLWGWACERGLCPANIVRRVKPPRPDEIESVPFSDADVRALVDASQRGRHPLRDRAILLCLIDSGLRASELCGLRLADIVDGGFVVMGKRRKQRLLPTSPSTVAAVQEYVRTVHQGNATDRTLFLANGGQALTRCGLLLLVKRIGARAGVANVHPHRFRHTFAIGYLRGGGDIYTLQKILGHSTLDMVKRYLAVADTDVQSAHQRASPVTRLKL